MKTDFIMALANNGKYVSERHDLATKKENLATVGNFNKVLKKQAITDYTSKQIVEMFKHSGTNLEWHHSGFYGKNMGKTYFISEKQQEYFLKNHKKMDVNMHESILEQKHQTAVKRSNVLFGFYWIFEANYNGRYGKKQFGKRLKWCETNENDKPKNFTSTTFEIYENNKQKDNYYTGWEVPTISEFE